MLGFHKTQRRSTGKARNDMNFSKLYSYFLNCNLAEPKRKDRPVIYTKDILVLECERKYSCKKINEMNSQSSCKQSLTNENVNLCLSSIQFCARLIIGPLKIYYFLQIFLPPLSYYSCTSAMCLNQYHNKVQVLEVYLTSVLKIYVFVQEL